jgi:hypothetical protein
LKAPGRVKPTPTQSSNSESNHQRFRRYRIDVAILRRSVVVEVELLVFGREEPLQVWVASEQALATRQLFRSHSEDDHASCSGRRVPGDADFIKATRVGSDFPGPDEFQGGSGIESLHSGRIIVVFEANKTWGASAVLDLDSPSRSNPGEEALFAIELRHAGSPILRPTDGDFWSDRALKPENGKSDASPDRKKTKRIPAS